MNPQNQSLKWISALIVCLFSTIRGAEDGTPPHPARVFECPTHIPVAANDRSDYFEWYDKDYLRKDSLDNFREETYGGRAQTYNDMKEMMYNHKALVFGPELKNGDMIFETACGEGFNLLITLEVLQEEYGINVTASGIDYVPQSIELANKVFDLVLPQQKGSFCWGDATNLSTIPDNTFDLAYTGAVDVITDPLHLWPDLESSDEQCSKSAEFCNEEDPLLYAVAVREQKLQEDWHSAWIKELIRIAKPGALIVVEDVAFSVCSAQDIPMDEGWGGVDPEWWLVAPYLYDWGIYVSSMRGHRSWYMNRYNVSFRKLREGDVREPEGEVTMDDVEGFVMNFDFDDDDEDDDDDDDDSLDDDEDDDDSGKDEL